VLLNLKVVNVKMAYENVESFKRCYGCGFPIQGGNSLNHQVISIITSRSGRKECTLYLTHNIRKVA